MNKLVITVCITSLAFTYADRQNLRYDETLALRDNYIDTTISYCVATWSRFDDNRYFKHWADKEYNDRITCSKWRSYFESSELNDWVSYRSISSKLLEFIRNKDFLQIVSGYYCRNSHVVE